MVQNPPFYSTYAEILYLRPYCEAEPQRIPRLQCNHTTRKKWNLLILTLRMWAFVAFTSKHVHEEGLLWRVFVRRHPNILLFSLARGYNLLRVWPDSDTTIGRHLLW